MVEGEMWSGVSGSVTCNVQDQTGVSDKHKQLTDTCTTDDPDHCDDRRHLMVGVTTEDLASTSGAIDRGREDRNKVEQV